MNYFKKIQKGVTVFKNNSWIYKMKYKSTKDKFITNLRDFSYEFLLVWNCDDERRYYIKFFALLIPVYILIKYTRDKFYARYGFALPLMGYKVHQEMKQYQTDLPRDAIEAENLNKLIYSREYTLKY